jgi:hypothetical protein
MAGSAWCGMLFCDRLYAVDFARMFPAEPPEGDGTTLRYLSRLLRPELVHSNAKALSSDSFSRFGNHCRVRVP